MQKKKGFARRRALQTLKSGRGCAGGCYVLKGKSAAGAFIKPGLVSPHKSEGSKASPRLYQKTKKY